MSDNILSLQAYEALSQKDHLPKVNRNANLTQQQAQKVAKDFEAVFISQMMKPMFVNTVAEAPFGGGSGEKIWRDMQLDEYGKAIANNGGIGIADSIVKEMLKMQEARK